MKWIAFTLLMLTIVACESPDQVQERARSAAQQGNLDEARTLYEKLKYFSNTQATFSKTKAFFSKLKQILPKLKQFWLQNSRYRRFSSRAIPGKSPKKKPALKVVGTSQIEKIGFLCHTTST